MPAEQRVEEQRHDGARKGADEKRRREGSAHAARGVGRGHGHHLEEHDRSDVEDHHPVDVAETVEERGVEQRSGIAVHERGEALVALAVERREDEEQDAQRDAGVEPFAALRRKSFVEGADA